jgi:A/G-specific adenine glycosylase
MERRLALTETESAVRRKLLAWYKKNKRDLPWRKTTDPYRIWVSEIMLQQTQVETVIPYYLHFIERFPDIHSLSESRLDDVMKAWENLGYYARVRNLHAAAKIIVEKYAGAFPDTLEQALSLPGIGSYTAGAVLSIAFRKRLPACDGNARRVISRLLAIRVPVQETAARNEIDSYTDLLVPDKNPGDFNQALMDLGASICIPGLPRCQECPLKESCRAKAVGLECSLPVLTAKKPLPLKHAIGGMILDRRKRFLIVQRSGKGLLAGLWRLPGGFRSDQESLESCVGRLVRIETGRSIVSSESITRVSHTFTHFRMKLHGYLCAFDSTKIAPPPEINYRWIKLLEMDHYAFGKADRALIQKMIKVLF